MAPISGQLDPDLAKRAAERLADADPVALLQRRLDVQDQAHPPTAMINDHDAVIASKGARKSDRAGCRGSKRRAPCGGKGETTRADPVGCDRA